jgi:Tol biopolymer transport system component
VLREYADQSEQAQLARARLAALGSPSGRESGMVARKVWAEPKTDFFGAISPDGKYISFVDWETGDLAIRDLEKAANRRLTNKGPCESSSDEAELSIWSPDSRQIAYQWSASRGYDLRVISLDNPTPRVLYQCKSLEEYIEPYDWSRDGKHILGIIKNRDANTQMVLLSVADGTVRTLKEISRGVSLAGAAISPDGRYVLYDYPQSESSWANDMFLLPIAGGNQTPVIEYPADDRVLGWAPD